MTKMRLRASIILVLTTLVAALLVYSLTNKPTVSVMVGVIGLILLYLNAVSEWVAERPLLSRIFARNLAIKYFERIFKIKPSSKKDFLAKKVSQEMVRRKLLELKTALDVLYKEEDKRISALLLNHSEENERIPALLNSLEIRELHSRVEQAKENLATAMWLAKFFNFDLPL